MQLSPEVTKFRSTLKEALYVEAVNDPTPNDDRNQRFIIGSRWINTTLGTEFVCVNNAPTAAVWVSGGGGGGGGSAPHIATVAPTVNDDSGDGYVVGQLWVDTAAQFLYVATDVTVGAAVWVDVTSGAGGTAVTTTADADPLLDGTNVQTQLTSISEILRNAVMYTYMAGMAGTAIYYEPSVVTGYNLTAL
jgi:hypothetical protein